MVKITFSYLVLSLSHASTLNVSINPPSLPPLPPQATTKTKPARSNNSPKPTTSSPTKTRPPKNRSYFYPLTLPSLPPSLPPPPNRKNTNEDKTRIFKQLTEAYNTLSDQDARRKYDSKLGISRVSSFYRPGGVGREGGRDGDIRAPRPPPDFKVFDHDEWNAWHYGEGGGVNKEPFVKR